MNGWKCAIVGTLMVFLSACVAERQHRVGLDLLEQGKPEQGLQRLKDAVQYAPDQARFRADLRTHTEVEVAKLLARADVARASGNLGEASDLLERVQRIEPNNDRAAVGLQLLARLQRHPGLMVEAEDALRSGDTSRATALARLILADNPQNAKANAMLRQVSHPLVEEQRLQLAPSKPINLEFRDASLKLVLEALSRASGVNFILDKDVRPDLRTTVFLRQSGLEGAIDFILQTNRLEKKVLNNNTILVYPSSPEKLKDYQELVVKGFYLANADVRQTQAMVKALLKTKDTFIDEKLNLLMIRDTPDAVRLAEKMIRMHDLAEPEVMLEVEVLEIKRSRLLELGVQWPSQLTLSPMGAKSSLTIAELRELDSSKISATIGSAAINLRRNVGDANILANPRIRARNREKAKIMIGDKVPVSTSTTTATGVVSESVQYLDVGIKLEVEPNVYLQDEIAIKIGLEVSSIANEIKTPAGSLAYQIGSRSASTVLRLKDGETQVLAGLINDEDRMASSRVPGLGDLPILGRLFGSQKDDRNKTEIVLSITPRLVRNLARPDLSDSEFWSGTESSLRTRPMTMPSGDDKPLPHSSLGQSGTLVPAVSENNLPAKPEPTVIEVQWQGPAQVKAGEEFKLAVRLKADGAIRSLPFQLGFDSGALQVLDIKEGEYLQKNAGQATISSNVDAVNGKAFVSVVRAGNEGVAGDASVAVLTVRALAPRLATELKMLSATPITGSGTTVVPRLPTPFVLKIE